MTKRLIWPEAKAIRLKNARLPSAAASGFDGLACNGFIWTHLAVVDGKLAVDMPHDAPGETVEIDLAGRIIFPGFVDIHTHLDKGHIWPRTPNPDGTFDGALNAARSDRAAYWSADDVRARMDFSLKCAYAHGTTAIRTHLDSFVEQTAISWGVADEMRSKWAGKIDLQMAALTSIESVGTEEFSTIAKTVADYGGILGTVAYMVPDLEDRLDHFFQTAKNFGLDADFHADETQDPNSACLHAIAAAKIRNGFDRPTLVGHCCSLARQADEIANETLDLVAEAGLDIVSLPMCNSYLQDRHEARTPRSRGVTLVHEMQARGTKVAFASDNTRDPFYAYGDLDMVEVMREASRIAHLDHPMEKWAAAFTATAADIIGHKAGRLTPGAAADFSIFRARDWTELFARPHGDRLVVRGGHAIDTTLPDYAELDDVVGVPAGTPS